MNKAKWEPLKEPYTEMGFNTWEVQCSACGLPQDEPSQVCPGCGAIMEGEYPPSKTTWWKIYYENRRHFKCTNCGHHITLGFWKWLWTPHMDMWRYRHIRCPYCKQYHWLQAIKVEE